MWENEEEDLSERSEQRGDSWYQLVNFYERGVIKLKRLLIVLIETSDEPFTVTINWRDVLALPPAFHGIL